MWVVTSDQIGCLWQLNNYRDKLVKAAWKKLDMVPCLLSDIAFEIVWTGGFWWGWREYQIVDKISWISEVGISFVYVILFLTIVEILQHVISIPNVRTTFFFKWQFFCLLLFLPKKLELFGKKFNVLSLTNFTYYWKFSLIFLIFKLASFWYHKIGGKEKEKETKDTLG
jgi:hypothetical protein